MSSKQAQHCASARTICVVKKWLTSHEYRTIATTEIDDLSDMPYSHDSCSLLGIKVYDFVCFCHTSEDWTDTKSNEGHKLKTKLADVCILLLWYS